MKTLFRIVHENPTPLMENRPDLPRNLVDLVEALMSKSPDDRPDDIFEMLSRLREKPAPAAQEAASEIGRFLDQAGREGQKDEKDGRFTLNPEKALEKLAQFQFARPHDYLLPLVAAGHALKSSAITFRTSKSGLRVHYDRPELEKQQIEGLFLAAVQSAENPLHHLGRGIVGVLSCGARVTLTSGRWQAKFEGLNPPSMTPGRSKGVTLSMSGELPQTFPSELLRRVQLSEAGVSWNGHPLNLQHELELLGEREGFRIFGSYCSQEPGLFLRVDGLTYQGGFHALSPTQLLLDGPWPLDISYRGISDNRLKERLGELARELLLDKIKDLLLTQPLRWDRPKDYLQLLPLVKDQDVQNKFASRVVLAAPDPYKLTGPAELETLLANACDLVRAQKLSSSRRAGTLLVAPALYDAWKNRSWANALSLAQEIYPAKPTAYWRFLLRCFILHGGSPDLNSELPNMLSILEELPEHRVRQWDASLRDRLKALTQGEPDTEQTVAPWKPLVPDGFFHTRAWLERSL